MAIFKRVNTAPDKLENNEMLIHKPDFQQEIDATRGRRGVTKVATASSLRDLFMTLTNKYAPEINPYKLKFSKYEGISIGTDDELRDLIFKIIFDNDLPLIDKTIEYHIKNRNPAVNTIFYVSDDLSGLGAFIKMGFNQQESREKVK